MRNPIPSCFRRPSGRPLPPPAQTSLTTSSYHTHLGPVSLTWSRTLLTIELRRDVDNDDEPIQILIRHSLLWRRKGSKRLHVQNHKVDVAWDLTRARFTGSSPEPSSGFFVTVSVDSEPLLIAGDMTNKRMKLCDQPLLVSRKEHVELALGAHRTKVWCGGREREVTVELGEGMAVAVDGRMVLHVRQIRWMFRGSERVEVEGGAGILISWDLHSWLFKKPETAAAASVVAFRFEGDEKEGGHFGSESSGGREERRKGKRTCLTKEISFSSTSSALSSASGTSSVMEWESSEEAEMSSIEGFTLLVYPCKR